MGAIASAGLSYQLPDTWIHLAAGARCQWCSSSHEADAVYNLAEFLLATDPVPGFLLTRALFCSHYERQLSCARPPPPTHTRRNSLYELLSVLGVPPGRSCFFFVAMYHHLMISFWRTPDSLLGNGPAPGIWSTPSRSPTCLYKPPLSRALLHCPLLLRGIARHATYARIHSPVGKIGTDTY